MALGPTFAYDQQFADAKTAVLALSAPSGRTTVAFLVVGLPESTWGKAYGAHAHVNACAAGARVLCTTVPFGVGRHRGVSLW